MPDITMCTGEGCPKKKSCYRHNATPSQYRQSRFVEPPWDNIEGSCAYFWLDNEKAVCKDIAVDNT